MNEPRGNWYLLTGLVLGLAFGLLYSWVISPIKYVNTEPVSLSATYKDEYRRVIALAYASTHDLGRASERLKLLDPGDSLARVVDQAQRMMTENPQSPEARALALLATNLGQAEKAAGSAATQPATQMTDQFTQTSSETLTPGDTPEVVEAIRSPTVPVSPTPTIRPTATITPTPTLTPRATATPAPTQSAPYLLKQQKEICDGSVPPQRIIVEVSDSSGNPSAGVQIVIVWQDGENRFYTGLFPEVDPGYADFNTAPGIEYTLRIGNSGELIKGLSPRSGCSIKLDFTQ